MFVFQFILSPSELVESVLKVIVICKKGIMGKDVDLGRHELNLHEIQNKDINEKWFPLEIFKED